MRMLQQSVSNIPHMRLTTAVQAILLRARTKSLLILLLAHGLKLASVTVSELTQVSVVKTKLTTTVTHLISMYQVLTAISVLPWFVRFLLTVLRALASATIQSTLIRVVIVLVFGGTTLKVMTLRLFQRLFPTRQGSWVSTSAVTSLRVVVQQMVHLVKKWAQDLHRSMPMAPHSLPA